jgi:hypothetical protein
MEGVRSCDGIDNLLQFLNQKDLISYLDNLTRDTVPPIVLNPNTTTPTALFSYRCVVDLKIVQIRTKWLFEDNQTKRTIIEGVDFLNQGPSRDYLLPYEAPIDRDPKCSC